MITAFFAWLLADLISGLVHWWEDRANTGTSRFKFINGVRSDNEKHHNMPGFFLRYSWWGNINTTAPIAWPLALLFLLIGLKFLAWTFLFLGFGNLIHRWAHEPIGKRPFIVSLIQQTGLFISPHQHAEHHFHHKTHKLLSREESYRRFCVMTGWLNPILDKIGFFDVLEYLHRGLK
jgi:uncharacterized iron-regulated membrane protein